ncbi:MAG TPA: hypothetical protein VMW72_05435 [Sedimentisphaerales bacterium]|nr:hypothetical protein [Sedimentisphaerales bacterium]
MNVNIYYTKTYNNETASGSGKNKPNSNPIKPNFRKAQMNVNSIITKDYRKTMLSQSKKTNPIKPNSCGFLLEFIPHRVYPAQSLPRTEFTPYFDAGMRGCGAGMTMLEDNA